MTVTQAPRPDLPPRSWCRPAHKPDRSTITAVPVIKGINAYEANTAYVDLHWTPVIGPTAVAIVRWINHQAQAKTVTEHQLAKAIGATGIGEVRRALTRLLDCGLATASPGALHISITFPTLSVKRATSFERTFAATERTRTNA